MTHIPGHAAPQPYLPPADISPAPYGFGGGAQTFNPFGAYANTLGPTPMKPLFGHGTGSVWGDIKQTPGIGFIPGLSTAAQWNEMGPWGRSASLGLDALDLATLGTSKFGTTPLRMLGWGGKWLGRNDPALAYLRGGDMPTASGSPTVSTNYFTGEPEVGISTYQGLRFPGENLGSNPQYYMQSMPSEGVVHPLPKTHPTYGSMYSEAGDLLSEPRTTYNVNPLRGQTGMFLDRPIYEVTGTPKKTLGSDTEALLDPLTAAYRDTEAGTSWGSPIPQQDIKLFNPTFLGGGSGMTMSDADLFRYQVNPNVLNPRTGKAINLETEFAKYDQFGKRIDPLWYDKLPDLPWMKNLPPYLGTTPLTVPARSVFNYNQSNNVRPPVRNRGNGDTGG